MFSQDWQITNINHQTPPSKHETLNQCWLNVYDAGPALTQLWFNIVWFNIVWAYCSPAGLSVVYHQMVHHTQYCWARRTGEFHTVADQKQRIGTMLAHHLANVTHVGPTFSQQLSTVTRQWDRGRGQGQGVPNERAEPHGHSLSLVVRSTL